MDTNDINDLLLMHLDDDLFWVPKEQTDGKKQCGDTLQITHKTSTSATGFTPAAVDEFGNVGASILVSVPCICGCSSVSVRNISPQPVNVRNANLVFGFEGIRR